jgi:hypothetical protein
VKIPTIEFTLSLASSLRERRNVRRYRTGEGGSVHICSFWGKRSACHCVLVHFPPFFPSAVICTFWAFAFGSAGRYSRWSGRKKMCGKIKESAVSMYEWPVPTVGKPFSRSTHAKAVETDGIQRVKDFVSGTVYCS